ncbi:hypothetical protein [uncultured Arcobacter sp.]|uniref:hypothetical protein n=1 Tax=uncultured Arcobacter sp. TaxID=165434 RepID=UPI0026229844|nr:hypothetical protein [uncultured Arcobacter sp.]
MKYLFRILITLMLPLTLYSFHDYEKEEHSQENTSIVNKMLNSTETYLKYTYDKLNQYSKVLDETLTDEKSSYKYENSSIHIETYYNNTQTKGNTSGVTFNVKVRLPQLKEKLKLVIENDDNKIGKEYEDNNESVPYKDDKSSLALEYDKYKKYYNLRTKAGVKLNSFVFINSSVSKEFDLTNSWNFVAQEKIELNNKNNFENSTTLSLKKHINNQLRFINTNQYYWNKKASDNNIYNSLRLTHILSSKNTLNYVTSISSNDNQTNFKTKNYDAYISYKHYIRKWLYYDIVPSLYGEREDNFKMRYAFKFRLGIVIGK